jgi:hypothetical protein
MNLALNHSTYMVLALAGLWYSFVHTVLRGKRETTHRFFIVQSR